MGGISAAELADFVESIPERMRRRITEVEEESARLAQAALTERSSGTLTRRDLARMGHPFAVRAPITPVDPANINHHPGGGFQDAWEQESAQVSPDAVTVRVVNRDPAGRRMGGTAKMIKRPIVEAVRQELAADRKRRLAAAAAQVLKGP